MVCDLTNIHVFDIRHIQEYWEAKKSIESDQSIHSYLSTRLKCAPLEVDKMMKMFPSLERATVRIVKPKLDYLLIGMHYK